MTDKDRALRDAYIWLLAFLPMDKRVTVVGQRLLANLRSEGAIAFNQDEQTYEADCMKTVNILKTI